MMYYYLVWVRSSRYHGSEALTYSSAVQLKTGRIVQVELQTESVLGIVIGPASRPRFRVKPILSAHNTLPLPQHLLKLAQWIQVYYPAPLGIITQLILPAHLPSQPIVPDQAALLSKPIRTDLPPLSSDQRQALEQMQARNTYLLHGTTGSGKTRIYIELSLRAIQNGKSALILTPEISLTSQLARNFAAVFDERVLVFHSQQTPRERQQIWLKILRSPEPLIIIGPRSAVFSPVQKLGLIVLDEAHEAAYKQEQAPQYQTGRVASYLARLTQASLVLGSATPSIADYYLASEKQKPIIRLSHLARPTELLATKIAVVDMKQRNLFQRSPYISQLLITAISDALSSNQQSLLYLNRRGTARLVLCERCGWQANCPHCSIPLTYHSDSYSLHCHSCSYHSDVPSSCPQCHYPSILFKTAGTKAIVEEVKRLFPQARIERFDTDNSKHERFEQHFEAIHRGEVDILVGTQLLAKGLDLPKLSTLGIVMADTGLYLPDFSASERTFQLLSQVMGRVGRGHIAGRAVIQTYHPEHPALRTALSQDYQSFYNSELRGRRQYFFPPFCHLLKLSCRRATAKSAENAAMKLKSAIELAHPEVTVEGPAPAFHERFQGKFQWQIVVKATHRAALLSIIGSLPANWSSDIDPMDLL